MYKEKFKRYIKYAQINLKKFIGTEKIQKCKIFKGDYFIKIIDVKKDKTQ